MTATEQRTTRDIFTTSIHGTTFRPISNGMLPAGTIVLRVVQRVPCSVGNDEIRFIVQDDRGTWIEQADEDDLRAAGINVTV